MDNNIKRSPKFTKALYKQKNPKYKNVIPKDQLSSNSLLIDNKEKAKDSNSKNDLIEKDKVKMKEIISQTSLLLSSEHREIEKKNQKNKKIFEKRYIVDDIDNIFVLLKEPKLKLHIQEFLHYFIVFLVCIYYWIFLFLTGIKIERNYYLTEYKQFDVDSDEQICYFLESSANIIIYNNSFKYKNFSSDENELFLHESDIVNTFYKPYLIQYDTLIRNSKLTVTMQVDYIIDKPLLSIVIINKEKWNFYFRYFSLCEFDSYYLVMIGVLGIGSIIGSFVFGFLSDIFGRRIIIIITLFISTIGTFGIYILSLMLDNYYLKELNFFQQKCESNEIICSSDILPDLYAQQKIRDKFKNIYIYYLFNIFLLNIALWPLLKSCMALLVENSKGELEVLINFRRYNFFFQGLPPIFAYIVLPLINNFTITFLILSIINFLTLLLSFIFLDESIRYYYEYCEWEKLTKVLMNTYKINLDDFRTLNEAQFNEFKKKENSKTFYKVNLYMYNNIKNKSYFLINQSYYKNFIDSKSALNRSIKRNVDFIIKLNDVKSHPFLIITSLWANHALKNSKTLLIIILILLYIIMDLFQKELLEPPYFGIKDLYFGIGYNYIINSVFFIYLIVNIFSNYFYYCFYRIECFKTVIYISQIIISLTLMIYHFIITNLKETPMNLNQYNINMTTLYLRDIRQKVNLLLLFIIYFALNGVIFYAYLLILKISKTIHRCTFFSLHSIALIIATVISELIYYYMENYFLFLAILNLVCLITFGFLSEFKELIYIMNDLKVNMFGIRKSNWQEKFKSL